MDYISEYKKWLESDSLSQTEHAELESIRNCDAEIESRFYAPLEFGTAGLRGTMGVGLNRMNIYVIRQASQGFANLICEGGEEAKKRGVVICFDCRNNSALFAKAAACVMAGNGVKVKLFESMRPTPELSFAVREYKAKAGINITASHNPKEYNGYKVYWEDGAQLPPEHAAAVAKQMRDIDILKGAVYMDYNEAVEKGMITLLGEKTDELFLENVLSQAINKKTVEKAADNLNIVYTPFHGTGCILVPEALKRLGIKHLVPVPEQMVPDGNFSTVKSPNPEETAGFYLAIDLALKNNANLIIGTDPDADRVGVMVRGKNGNFEAISGNQMGVLLLDYIINAKKAAGTLPEKAAALKTIVTTEMARAVCEKNGVEITDTFTGFKFMAEKIKEYGSTKNVIFAYEESYGYMMGNYVRDKDAVTASMMIAEMAAYYSLKNMTLLDAMESLYEKYGYYAEKTVNLVMPGVYGIEKMAKLMRDLRAQPLHSVCDTPVLYMLDYLNGERKAVCASAESTTMELSGSNVIAFELADGTRFMVRPSGTEPKIKVYVLAHGSTMESCKKKVDEYAQFAMQLAE